MVLQWTHENRVSITSQRQLSIFPYPNSMFFFRESPSMIDTHKTPVTHACHSSARSSPCRPPPAGGGSCP